MKNQRGFSIVELMIASTIGLMLTGAMISVFVSTSSSNRVAHSRANIQENARFAISMIEQDTRISGQMGCFNIDRYPSKYSNRAKPASKFYSDLQNATQGFNSTASTWSPTMDAIIGTGGHTPTAGFDALVLRIPAGLGVNLNSQMSSTSADIPISNTTDFQVGSTAVVADCAAANVFKVTAVNSNTSLGHDASANTAATLTRAFGVDAIVIPINVVIYFVAPSSDGVAGNNSLWRQVDNNAAEEIVTDVEGLEFDFGIDTDTDPDGSANSYVTADQLFNATTGRDFPILGIKVSILFRSSEDNIAVKSQKYNFNGTADIVAVDKRLHIPYTTNISIRNRGS